MSAKFLHNLEILDPEVAASLHGGVVIEGGKIAEILPARAPQPAGLASELANDLPKIEAIDMGGLGLAPGFLDLHFHGELIFAGNDALPEALSRTARRLVEEGTTGYLATTVAWDDARIEMFITRCREKMTQPRQGSAELLGVHLEGPWINPAAAGAQPSAGIKVYDASEGGDILDSGHDAIRMVTFAPEVQGSGQLLDALRRRNIVASLGHSLARHHDLDACVNDGLTHVTHLFNAMGAVHHREPGIAGWALAEDRVTCDLICDGVHVHPAMVRTAGRAKGDGLLLITDRIEPPSPSAPGENSFGSGPIHNDGSAIRMADGNLAGSNLSLDRALRNAQKFGAMNRLEAIAAVTLRPARLLGIESQRGTLRVGARADFAILDSENQVRETWISGERVFANSETNP